MSSTSKTKSKILKAAIILFNERGLSDVPLEEVATMAGVSTSIVNYHFQNKKKIIESDCLYLIAEMRTKWINPRLFTGESVHAHFLKHLFEIQYDSRFLFMDTRHLFRRFPSVESAMMEIINEGKKIFEMITNLSIGKGDILWLEGDKRIFFVRSLYYSLFTHISSLAFDQSLNTKEEFTLNALQNRYVVTQAYLSNEGKNVLRNYIFEYAEKNNLIPSDFVFV